MDACIYQSTLRRDAQAKLRCATAKGLIAWLSLSVAAIAEVQPIAALRGLPVTELQKHPPIHIRGVVTLRAADILVLQDDTAGIYVNFGLARARGIWADSAQVPDEVQRGSDLEILGTIDPGGFSPPVMPSEVTVLGTKPLPVARQTDPERFFSGADDCQLIELTAVIHGVYDGRSNWRLTMETDSRTFSGFIPKNTMLTDPRQLIDAVVRVTGVPTTMYNSRGEFLQPWLFVGDSAGLDVMTPPACSPFDAPKLSIASLARFRPEPLRGHMICTAGVVIHALPGQAVYLEDGAYGIRAETETEEHLTPGTRVEVAGFVTRSGRVAALTDAAVRKIGAEASPSAADITPDEIVSLNTAATTAGLMALPGDYDGCLIRFPATLLEHQANGQGGVLMLSASNTSVIAVAQPAAFAMLRHIEPGSELAVTGIVQMNWEFNANDWPAQTLSHMSLLLRSAEDVQLVRAPSRWTPRRLATILAAVAATLAGCLAWVVTLRLRVTAQAVLLATEMRSRRDAAIEFNATLKERNRLAANLHDTLLQTLGGIGYQLDACEGSRGQDGDEGNVHFDVARRMVNHATSELHSSVWAMRSLPIRQQSFPEALRTLVARIGEGHAAETFVHTSGTLGNVPEFVAGNLLLIVQEAVYNALRHGRPANVHVTVSDEPATQSIRVEVRDDGRGFAVGNAEGVEQGHFGLHGMRERAERLGGTLVIESTPGSGTTVRATVIRRDYDREIGAPAEAESAASL